MVLFELQRLGLVVQRLGEQLQAELQAALTDATSSAAVAALQRRVMASADAEDSSLHSNFILNIKRNNGEKWV